MIVVDASVAVKWFVNEAGASAAHELLSGAESLIGPDFVIYETLNVLRRKYKRSEIDAVQLEKASGELAGFFDLLVPATALIDRTVALSAILDHGIYDSAYLACALQHDAVLITADEVFAKKAVANGFGDHIASIHLNHP